LSYEDFETDDPTIQPLLVGVDTHFPLYSSALQRVTGPTEKHESRVTRESDVFYACLPQHAKTALVLACAGM